ncbi:CD3072 family TudS-related putative desulfidase [uncultured Anaerococcus sp.]|uniref:CD3072 family TudS-related putative desulfidase n=1 Tax=uncultured Anaerococcus sp. TaxID=293428 RepID=UPI0026384216|nr:CD3072 family TudS-related putative desulfidase [uncultured Anaerococcus sp.]
MDRRGMQIVFLSHCILNQNTVVEPLARAKGSYNQIIAEILNKNIGIYQMPCPEFEFLGIDRKSMTYSNYDNLENYRRNCSEYAFVIYKNIKEYLDKGYIIKGIMGINESPTCSISGQRGIFMEELFRILEDKKIVIPYIEVSINYIEDKQNDLKKIIDFLEN